MSNTIKNNTVDTLIDSAVNVTKHECPSKLVLGLIGLAVGTYIYFLRNENVSLTQKIQELNEQNQLLESNIKTYELAVDTQNRAFDQLEETAKIASQQMNTLAYEIEEQRKLSNKKVQDILNEYRPEDCDQSILYLKNSISDLQWSK